MYELSILPITSYNTWDNLVLTLSVEVNLIVKVNAF